MKKILACIAIIIVGTIGWFTNDFLVTQETEKIVTAVESLEHRLENTEKYERANKAAERILSTTNKSYIEEDGFAIEIVKKHQIDGGFDVFARAWENGKQIGFGPDGTVDIERFRFFYPPMLEVGEDGSTDRELFGFIKQAIAVKTQKFGDSQIVYGKEGNTTSTFFSDYNPESTTVDGDTYRFGVDTTWAAARDSADALNADSLTTNTGVQNGLFSGKYYVRRTFHLFDTSALPDTDTIDSATISIYRTGSFTDTNNMSMVLVQVNPASDTNLVVGDYDAMTIDSPDEGAPRYDISLSTNNSYSNISLNATGISWINKTGITKLGFRGSHDVDDTGGSLSGFNNMNYNTADVGGSATTTDPILTIEHSAGAAETVIPRTYVPGFF